MATRDEIIAFCDEKLDAAAFGDYGPNGLQVPGAPEVGKVATCVSAHLEAIQRAVEAGAQLLIAHHGLFWEFHPRALSMPMAERLRAALGADLSIAAYHLPLDAHREIGNNALLCEALGLVLSDEEFGEVKGRGIGVVGRDPRGIPAQALFERVRSVVSPSPLIFDTGPTTVRSVGVVSGAGSSALGSASHLGLDAFVTGEPAEHAMADAKEAGLHFIAAGHYATETRGVQRLGELIAAEFGVAHEFIDVPNPI
jgi:dinuclear metal center YbgI/SA1388 family protein